MNREGACSPASAPEAQARGSLRSSGAALYPFLMGADWNALDVSVQRFHGAAGDRRAAGQFQIHRGRSRLARLFASLLGLPAEGRDVATELAVEFRPASSPGSPGCEIWRRNFANQPLSSVQYLRGEKVLGERFGLVELSFHLSAHEGALLFEPLGAALVMGKLRLALPTFLRPHVQAKVTGAEGFPSRLKVSVQLALPFVGPILSYEGYLEPEEAKP